MRKQGLGRLGVALAVAASLFMGGLAMVAPVAAFADDAPAAVAKIDDVKYATFDEAVAAATSDDIVVLLTDATTAGISLKNDLTVDGGGNTLTFTDKGINLGDHELFFAGVTVVMNGVQDCPGNGWTTILGSKGGSLGLFKATMTLDGTGTASGTHAIYLCGDNSIDLLDSTLTIKNYPQDAIEWDGGSGYAINAFSSTVTLDHNRSGIAGTFAINLDASNLNVTNSVGNGSNGSSFNIKNGSVVDFSNNGSHGLSASALSVANSTLTATGNGLNGIVFTGAGSFVNSDVTVSGTKGKSYWNAGIRLMKSKATLTVDAKTSLHVTDNLVTGIFLDAGATMTVEDGADMLVTGNVADQANCSTKKDLAQSGGGIVVRDGATATLPSSAKIYNNSAALAGDDLYVEGNGNITFSGAQNDGSLKLTVRDDGSHAILGWYDDSADARWSAHGDTVQVAEVQAGTHTGVFAAKAAHGVVGVSYKWVSTENPADAKLPADETGLVLGAAYTAKAQDPVDGWTFDGWYVDEALTTKFADGTALSSDTVLYGKWTKNPETAGSGDSSEKPTLIIDSGESGESGKPVKKGKSGTPQTGDPTSLGMIGALAAAGMTSFGTGLVIRKKKPASK